jgi:hypothetical protein
MVISIFKFTASERDTYLPVLYSTWSKYKSIENLFSYIIVCIQTLVSEIWQKNLYTVRFSYQILLLFGLQYDVRVGMHIQLVYSNDFFGGVYEWGWVCFIFDRLLGENNSRDAAILYYNPSPPCQHQTTKWTYLYHRP